MFFFPASLKQTIKVDVASHLLFIPPSNIEYPSIQTAQLDFLLKSVSDFSVLT